jgi:hypothetical protein
MKKYTINIEIKPYDESEFTHRGYIIRGYTKHPRYNNAKIAIDSSQLWMGTSEIFFHELAHAYLGFFHRKFKDKKNEKLATEIGTAVAKIVHEYIKKEKWNSWYIDKKLPFPKSWR